MPVCKEGEVSDHGDVGGEDEGSDDGEDGGEDGVGGPDELEIDDGQAGGETEAEGEAKAGAADGGSGLDGSLLELVRSLGTQMVDWADEQGEPWANQGS